MAVVLTSGSLSCVMTVTRLALHPRELAETWDIVDDRVHGEGALRPRLVPFRVHGGGVHAPVLELLVEQDAADELHCRLHQPKWRLVFSVSIDLRLSSVVVIVHASENTQF